MISKVFRALVIPLLFVLLYPFQHKLAGKWEDEWIKEIIYLPPPVIFENSRFGFEGLLSDILWIRGFHYIEGQLDLPPGGRYGQLEQLYQVITTLDPYFIGAYHYGYLFLWALARNPRAAERLLEKGIKYNPDSYDLLYDIGVLNILVFKNFAKAEKYLDAAVRQPDCPLWIVNTASFVKKERYGKRAALRVWQGLLEDKSEQVRKIAYKKVLRLTREIALEELDKAIAEFEGRKGRAPANLKELLDAGIISRIPEDAEGGKYVLDPTTHRAKLVLPGGQKFKGRCAR